MKLKHSKSKVAPFQGIDKLLEAANSASQTVAALHMAFMAFCAYFGVIIWGTTHEEMLRISPVKLPILDVELPLTTFYAAVPWLLVLLHFNLLMQLELLSRKLWNLDQIIPATKAGQLIRDHLFIFPFTHLIAGRSNVQLIRWLLSLVVGISVIALPLSILLAAQIRFLPYHDETITWSQRLAVWVDAVLLFALWPLIASASDSALEWWRDLRLQLFSYCPRIPWNRVEFTQGHQIRSDVKGAMMLVASVSIIVLISIVAVIPGNVTVQNYYSPSSNVSNKTQHFFEDFLINLAPASFLTIVEVNENVKRL